MDESFDRRSALRLAISTAAVAAIGAACAAPPSPQPIGLLGPDRNGVRLPPGFRSEVVARSGERVKGGHYWHDDPDGAAVFPRPDGGWTYVSNSESLFGGVGALDFAADGRVIGARPLLFAVSSANCAGGATPWGTWLSCEEHPLGRVWEVNPLTGKSKVLPRMGVFRHEAAAVDPVGRAVYLTEDEGDGRLYRYDPTSWPDLRSGTLRVATLDQQGNVTWTVVPNPTPTIGQTPTRHQVRTSTPFDGGEGAVHRAGHVLFTTKGDGRVWDLDPSASRCTILYDAATSPGKDLSGVDNIATQNGGIYVAEDGGDMQLVLVSDDGRTWPCLQVVGHSRSEITGPAFDPSGTRLYFSSQRGTYGRGLTFQVTGPWATFQRQAVAGRA
jgi:secreted PhoX family phosphatase